MLKYNLINQKGEVLSQIELNKSIFATLINKQVLYDVINAQRAAMRQGTHATKNRSLVAGGGKKPWRQKGTGRARHGSIRSPLWRGGGVVFGPSPRSYGFKINRKISKLAFKMALSYHFNKNNVILLDSIALETYKTKEMQSLLNKLNISQKALIITKKLDKNLYLSARNLSKVLTSTIHHVSVYQLLCYHKIILTQEVVDYLKEYLS